MNLNDFLRDLPQGTGVAAEGRASALSQGRGKWLGACVNDHGYARVARLFQNGTIRVVEINGRSYAPPPSLEAYLRLLAGV